MPRFPKSSAFKMKGAPYKKTTDPLARTQIVDPSGNPVSSNPIVEKTSTSSSGSSLSSSKKPGWGQKLKKATKSITKRGLIAGLGAAAVYHGTKFYQQRFSKSGRKYRKQLEKLLEETKKKKTNE
tara:strand:- start:304 stop:678 length:375 start_codon:yes stop_codon:yes gene_type:complete